MIVGFVIDSLSAKRNDIAVPRGQEIGVNTTPTITSLDAVDTIGKKDAVKFAYSFECKYSPSIGEMTFEGNVLWRGESGEDVASVVEKWDKEKRIDEHISLEIMNTILRRCLSKAITIADELRLPPPLQFPMVVPKKENDGEKPKKK